MPNIGIIGIGYWGANLVRAFASLPKVELKYLCDLDENLLRKQKRNYPHTTFTNNYQELLKDKQLEGIVIASSAKTHFELAKQALEASKHIYVEKPLSLSVVDAERLLELSIKKGKTLMVGHLLKYHPAVDKLKTIIEKGSLGEVHYLYSQRVNLGRIRKDENSLWSLAPHDISISLHLLGDKIESVTAIGQSYLQPKIEDVVFLNLKYKDKKMSHIHISWLDPHKIRKITIVGSKKMAVFDDMESSEKIKIYDKGAEQEEGYLPYEKAISLRFGDITIPHIEMREPLKILAEDFVNCILHGKKPKASGEEGLTVVRILNAAQSSLEKGGEPIFL